MRIINGQKRAIEILDNLRKEIKEKKIKPSLAIILANNDPASRLYVRIKEKTAKKIGVDFKKYLFSDKISEEEILEKIDILNQDNKINGILVQMPLSKEMSADRIIQRILPAKDVDGFLPQSKFNSPFILAIWEALKLTREKLKDKKILALVNSDIFGKNLCFFLKKKDLKINYLKPADFTKEVSQFKKTDVLITALGKPNFINSAMIKKGSILIDGGISKKGNNILGDIDRNSVQKKAAWLSPSPGGVGPLTVAFLFKNLILAKNNKSL